MDYSKHIDFSNYLFRASSVGHIMAKTSGLSSTQKELLKTLSAKKSSEKGLTVKQQETLDSLIFKRDNLELSEGAKTYLRKLYREVESGRRKELKSLPIKKGNLSEEDSITILSIYDDEVYENNKERVNNAWLTGECDIKPKDKKGIDIKSSWDYSTFPWKDEKLDPIYDYQNLSYIDLYNADEWETVYVLTNMPDSIITDLIYRESFNHINNEVPEWKKLEILNTYIYDEENFYRLCKLHDCLPNEASEERAIDIFTNFIELPIEKRIVRKSTVRNNDKIDLTHKMIEISRVYLNSLNFI